MRYNDWIAYHADVIPEKPALVLLDEGRTLTYGELSRRIDRVARWLASEGIGVADRVAIVSENHLAHWELFFATAKLGALFIPLNFRLAPAELGAILKLARPRVLVASAVHVASARETLRGSASVLSLQPASGEPGYDDAVEAHDGGRLEPAEVGLDTVHQVLYTSGTTGTPKGAMITFGQMHWNSVNTGLACDLTGSDSTVTYTPMFHTGGLHVLSTPLFHRGGTVYLTSKFEPERVLSAYEEHRITTLFGVPTTFQSLAESESFRARDLSSVRFCLCGGAPCPIPLIETYAARGLVFRQGFGMTEVGPNCFSLPPADAVRKAGTVGRPILHVNARVVDAEGNRVAPGVIGELELSGPVVSAGYLDNPDARLKSRRGAWFRTGDLASVDDDGYYRIVGRSKEMWISGGENVYPAEIENALATHPAVSEASCFGVPDEKWGEIGWAAVVLRPEALVSPDELAEFLQQRLARYKVPKRIDVMPELPRNASGKVLKHAVRALMEAVRK